MKIFIVGSMNMDLVIGAPVLPKNGMTIEGTGFMANAGGKGANQAVACARLGGEAVMVGCVGAYFGDELAASLKDSGVDTTNVARDNGLSSGIAVIIVVDGDNRIILDRGANMRVDEALIDGALAGASAGDFLVVQLEIPPASVAYALKRGKEIGMTTVLNPAPAVPLERSCFENCDYFVPNQTEAEFYGGVYPQGEASARACAKNLAAMGVKHLIVTMGEAGAAYADGETFFTVDACPVKAVDTTAAGDTFVGAFVVRLSEGADVREAMRFACRAAAVTVTRRGAQQSIPFRSEVEERKENRA